MTKKTFGDAITDLGFTDAARLLGRKGGRAKSEAKTQAARQNAKKGGWPKGRTRQRYCGPCDRWWPARTQECPACGADTDKAE